MNEQAANIRPRYEAVSTRSGLFKDPEHPALRSAPIQQLWREHMLCQTMLDNGLYDSGLFLVVHPAKNEDCSAAVASYRQHLQEPSGRNPVVAALTLEECIQGLRVIGEAELADASFPVISTSTALKRPSSARGCNHCELLAQVGVTEGSMDNVKFEARKLVVSLPLTPFPFLFVNIRQHSAILGACLGAQN